jgi:glycerol dehydrogenase
MFKRTFISPARYVQGKGIIEEAGYYINLWSCNPFLIGGSKAVAVVKDSLQLSLQREGLELAGIISDVRKCTEEKIFEASEKAKAAKADLIIGTGGGSAVDCAKAAANNLKIPVATIPTVASTNADISAVSVIVDENGRFQKSMRFHENPKVVLVDTQVLASAPPQFLVSGMGDALACRFETEACFQSGSQNHSGGHALNAIVAVCRLCFDTLMNEGQKALRDVKNEKVTPSVERIIEAIKFHSGTGFENGGNAAAHAIHNGLVRASRVQGSHGEIVAFSTIAQLFLEDRVHSLIERVVQWCYAVGLPVTLSDLSLSEDCIPDVSEKSCAPGSSIHNEPFRVTPQDVARSIKAAHQLGAEISHS